MPSCFGLCFTQESSKQPRKGYNKLVPALFPKDAPKWEEAIDLSISRKIGNLEEYVQANVQKAPKVSRRLSRRVSKEAASSNGLAYCKVGLLITATRTLGCWLHLMHASWCQRNLTVSRVHYS